MSHNKQVVILLVSGVILGVVLADVFKLKFTSPDRAEYTESEEQRLLRSFESIADSVKVIANKCR
jgi:predicted ATPase